jgi:hypothetical protein
MWFALSTYWVSSKEVKTRTLAKGARVRHPLKTLANLSRSSLDFLCVLCVKAFSEDVEEPQSSIGKRFVKPRGWFRQFARFEDGSTVQTLNIFRVGILGDKLRAGVPALSGIVHQKTPELRRS